MPLPILAAMAVGAGLYSLYKKGTSDEPKKTSPRLKRKLDVKTKTQLNFEISLISAAAHADGVIEQSEDEFIKERISEFKEECANDEEFYKSLSNKLDNPPSIKDLSEILNALDDDDIEKYQNLIEGVLRSDGRVTTSEKVFLYRCSRMFNGLDDHEIYMFSSENQHNTVNSITYLNINDTIAGFTIETPIENEIYITHPAQLGEANQELILLSSLHSDSFLTSQDTEIVNTAREAGAKKVTISTYNSESKNELESSKGELDTKTIKTQASKNVSNNLKFSESSNLRFEFQGNETSIFNKVLKNFKSPEKEILKKSKWLQYDPDLTEFVLSCFSENKLSYFEKEVSMERQEVAIRSAKLALECNLFKSHNSIDGELDTKLASIKKHTKRYTVEF